MLLVNGEMLDPAGSDPPSNSSETTPNSAQVARPGVAEESFFHLYPSAFSISPISAVVSPLDEPRGSPGKQVLPIKPMLIKKDLKSTAQSLWDNKKRRLAAPFPVHDMT
ncbi:MAG: hypothetical protein IMF08_18535 [Proteobacteria bacterium]|nr:hypothetical protein [Pseudomonadota bacterium]MCK4868749.1 hypothetical protein [Alphaproteobacteria bacterium]